MRQPREHLHDEDVEEVRPLVDVTLIDEMLRMTPRERLELNDRTVETILELRESFRKQRDGDG